MLCVEKSIKNLYYPYQFAGISVIIDDVLLRLQTERHRIKYEKDNSEMIERGI